MDRPPSLSTDEEYRAAVQCFIQARDQNMRKDFLDRDFVLVPAVTKAVRDSLPRLLKATYARNDWSGPRIEARELDNCLPILYTLLDLEKGHLVHHFKESDEHTDKLPVKLETLKNIFPANQSDVAQRFYTQQWRWCPMEFDVHMHIKLSDKERIVPITKRTPIEPARDSIRKPDRKATLWVVEVPRELVSERLTKELRDKDNELWDTAGSAEDPVTWRMVVKQFKQSTQSKKDDDSFKRERNIFRELGKKPGIVQCFGWYESRQPAGPGHQHQDHEVFDNLVLELGDQDLYSAFQKENPPVHFQEIRDFWRSLFDVADALASIQTIKRTSYTDYVWHGDIKPENILDVETGFKLADPGEAVVKKFDNRQQIDVRSLKACVPGGTRTFAAPEKTSYSAGDPEPEVTQGSDIWSLGCVFSVSATYAVLGKEGVKQYRLFRQKAPKGPGVIGDSFHDGTQVLPGIAKWHQYLVACLREHDTYTERVLDIVDKQMLITPGEDRITGAELSRALAAIHSKCQSAGEHLLTTVPPEIVNFLTEELGPRLTEQSNLEDVPRTITQSGTEMFREDLLYASRTSEGRPTRRQPTDEVNRSHHNSAIHSSFGLPENLLVESQVGGVQQPRLNHTNLPRVKIPQQQPATTFWEVEQELKEHGVKTNVFGMFPKPTSVYGKSMGGKPDRLANHFDNRDIVWLVDNSSSMAKNWAHATYLLRVLVWRCLHYDDDGMELKFTIGNDDLNPTPNKKESVEAFVNKMIAATPKPNDTRRTDMGTSLQLIINSHFKKYNFNDGSPMRRKLTILVLTDGLWAQEDEYSIDDDLVNCIKKIPDVERNPQQNSSATSPPSRPLSIQFIRFGDDAKAIERLDRLDNHLADMFLPDVIDHESANGDVYKMFLGSMLEDFDNKPIQGAAVGSPTPALGRQRSFRNPSRQSLQSAPLSAPTDYFPEDNASYCASPSQGPSRSPSFAATGATESVRSRPRQDNRHSAPMLMGGANRRGTYVSQAEGYGKISEQNLPSGGDNYYSHQTMGGRSSSASIDKLAPVPRRSSTRTFGGNGSSYGASESSKSVSSAYQGAGSSVQYEDPETYDLPPSQQGQGQEHFEQQRQRYYYGKG